MFNKDGVKQPVLIGIILILVGAIIALIVLLNYYFTAQLNQIQAVTVQNNQRIGQIESFLNTLESQLKATSQEKMMKDLSGNTTK